MDFPVALILNPGLVTANPDNLSVPEVEAGGPGSWVDLLLQPPTLSQAGGDITLTPAWSHSLQGGGDITHTCLKSLWE